MTTQFISPRKYALRTANGRVIPVHVKRNPSVLEATFFAAEFDSLTGIY